MTVPRASEDLATAELYALGTAGVEVQEAGAEVVLLAYFDEERTASLRSALEGLGSVEEKPVPEVDWVARFREGFTAIRADPFLVAPAWRPIVGDRVLLVDPGRAFGTGSHETTRLCIRALAGIAAERPLGAVLDLGTGAGLLAVAAARLGARLVVATDLDPEAMAQARHHARLNAAPVQLCLADLGGCLQGGSFDLVLANLTLDLFLGRSEQILSLVRPGGDLVASGLLVEDVPSLSSSYPSPSSCASEGEWACLTWRIH